MGLGNKHQRNFFLNSCLLFFKKDFYLKFTCLSLGVDTSLLAALVINLCIANYSAVILTASAFNITDITSLQKKIGEKRKYFFVNTLVICSNVLLNDALCFSNTFKSTNDTLILQCKFYFATKNYFAVF